MARDYTDTPPRCRHFISMRFVTTHVRIRDAFAARHEPEAIRFLARIYWTVLIVVCAIVSVCAIAYGVWEFFRLPRLAENANMRAQPAFTKADVQSLLKAYEARGTKFETRLRETIPVKDPSK